MLGSSLIRWPKRVHRHAYIERILTISRLTAILAKGMCLSRPECTCKSDNKARCHAVRRYAGLMTPVARHLFKTGEYRHD